MGVGVYVRKVGVLTPGHLGELLFGPRECFSNYTL